ncbi:glycosyltransferase family 4 protein [Micromonospora echinofusca]|uniref:Glycosyltransferase n=1 Tax=Micromonospora echinofusca TaxID=47858 RepID=A0ABS3VMW6_MICEH|nr:glycosyltransferase family 4 protein [Micromonospora echinofusca]MBO4205811.1 glycosyltransferase [Micromonospora echinofusca]
MTENRQLDGSGPLRVLQVINTSAGGDWFYHQVLGLTRRGHQVTAVLPGEGPLTDRVRGAGIPTELVPINGFRPRELPRVIGAEFRLIRLINRLKPDVVHTHLLKATVACRLATLVSHRALYVDQLPGATHLHSPILRRIDLATLRRADVVIASCHGFAERYRQFGARSVATSHYGFDVHRFDPTTSPLPFREEFGLDVKTPVVGMVAHMYPTPLRAFREIGVKGHEVLIDAVPRLLDLVPEAQVFVIGDEFRGATSYRQVLQSRADRLGVGHRTHLIGHRSDIANILAGIDVLVTPSLEEAASGASVEALLMRTPVVASNVGGLPDTVQHGETGLLVPPKDPVALADAVAELLHDPERRRAMGELGRIRCLERFDYQRTVADVEAVYRAALRARSGRP